MTTIVIDFGIPVGFEASIPISVTPVQQPGAITETPRTVADYLALVSQWHSTRPKFMAVLAGLLQPFVDAQEFLNNLPKQFDLDTAIGVQLDQTGQWIGRSRYIEAPITNVFFSWDTVGLGWEQGYWLGKYTASEGIRALDDETYRFLLYAKVGVNNWDGSNEQLVGIIEELLQGQGALVSINDGLDMSMTVTVSGLANALLAALIQGGYLPIKPAGVSISYVVE